MEEVKSLRDRTIEMLKTCYDPEIPVDIYELGLIYEINVNDGNDIHVKMTLTSPACPVAETLPPDTEIARALIERRNLRMAERLNSKMQDRRSRFVVVGVGHLVGPQSIPALLAKRGYRVRQLGTAD